MPETLKQKAERRLLYRPFLRMLVVEGRFRWALGLLLAGMLLVPFSLLKIWRTTPPDFLPIVRVSLLDFGQVWSLRRAALREAAAGRFGQALSCWEMAAANNPGDPELVRGYLQLLASSPPAPDLLERAAGRGLWLLYLTRTNAADLALVGRTLGRIGSPEDLASLLERHAGLLPVDLELLYARALFDLGQTEALARHWRNVRPRLGSAHDQDHLRLFDAMVDAQLGTASQRTAGLAFLRTAMAGPPRQVEAARALLLAGAHHRDTPLVEEAVQKLQSLQASRIQDQVALWRLWIASGRSEFARPQALAWNSPPANAREALLLIQVRMELGLREAALASCEDAVSRMGVMPEIWLAYGSLLMELRRWETLRQIAVRMRLAEGSASVLTGYAHFLEGRAEFGLSQLETAQQSFRQAAASSYPAPFIARSVAYELLRIRYPAEAGEILQKVREPLARDVEYWRLVFDAADQVRNVPLMREAAEKAYALLPEDPIIMNNYAAVLLILRDQPELAAKLTLALLTRHPAAIEPVVNHAAALLMNRRVEEADQLLRRVDQTKLTPAQSTLFNLDRFELELARGGHEEARRLATLIRPAELYPPQQQWFSNALSQLAQP